MKFTTSKKSSQNRGKGIDLIKHSCYYHNNINVVLQQLSRYIFPAQSRKSGYITNQLLVKEQYYDAGSYCF